MFNSELQDTFTLFSSQHILASGFVFLIIALIIVNQSKLRESKYFNHIRIGLGILTLSQEVLLNIYRIAFGEWMIGTSLPLQLCGLAVITSSIVLITKSKKLFINTFFVMLIGATMALITPGIDKNLGFPHFRFFQFFLAHGLIVINFTFILFVMNFHKDVKYKTIYKNFVSLAILAVIMLGVNLLTDGNYMYLMHKPYGDTAFDLFGEHPWYIINILWLGVPVLFHLFYVPFFIRDYRRRKALLV